MSETKRVPFVFTLLDYKAMEEYFEQQAVEGWMLEKIHTFTMTFKKIEPIHIKFSVDVFPYVRSFDSYHSEAVLDYRELCEKSGWTFITSSNKLQVFYTEDKLNTVPIQTDPVQEERIIKKAFKSPEVLTLFILFPIFLLSFGGILPFQYDQLFLNSTIVSTIMLPLLLFPVTLYVVYYGMWFWKAKRNVKKGEDLPRTSVKSALFRGRFHLIVSATALAIYLIAIVIDAINGHTFPLVFLIVPLGGAGIGIWFKKKGLSQNRSRRKNILLFALLIFGFITVLNFSIFGIFASQSNLFENLIGINSEVPDDYDVPILEDFGLEETPHTQAFSRKSSVIVPRSYEYHEISSEGTIRTRYYEAINPEIADYIFEGMLDTEGSLLYRSVSKAPEDDWNVDSAYYLKEDETMIVLLKDNAVVMLVNEMGFSDETVEIATEQLGL